MLPVKFKSHIVILLLLCAALFPDALLAGEEIITKIDVEGNRRIEAAAILSSVKSRVGDYFSKDLISEDIKRVFQMGYFDDVRVEYLSGDLGPQLIFRIKERPFIKEIKIKGNKELKKETVKEAITVRESTIYSADAVEAAKEKVAELYEEKGFFLAEITHHLEEDGDEAALVFEVVEGKKIRIKKINILGNSRMTDRELLKIRGVETKEGGFFSWLTDSGKFEEETLQKDIDLMRAFYYNNGFIQVKIEEPQVFMSPDRTCLYVTIRIDEGDQFNTGEISFAGDLLDETDSHEVMKATLRVKEGDVFSSEKMRFDIVTLTDRFGDKGYAYANVTPRTDVDEEKKIVNITYNADKGNLVYIERINIYGNTKTRDKVVRREIKVSEGELYNRSAIRRSRQKVFNLGYFKNVNFTEERGSSDDKININIEIEEGPTGTLTVGAGYSSIDGLVGMIQVSQGNLFGRGQKLSLNAEFGGESDNYSLSFTHPYIFDTKITAGFDLFKSKRDYTDYSSSRKGGGVRVGRSIGEYSRINMRYRYEEVDINSVDPTAPQIIIDAEGVTRTSSIQTTLSRDSRNNYINPSEGSDSSILLEYAGGLLGQDNNYYKVVGSSSFYLATPPWDHVFMMRGKAGYAHGLEGDDLGIDERFFLGGINTMRGFKYRSIGPTETGNDGLPYVVGGNKMILFNAEYLFPISEEANLKGLFFIDAGNVYGSDDNMDLGNLRESAGYGFRWYSPIGPLRLEWGQILDRKDGEAASRWEFSIGTFF